MPETGRAGPLLEGGDEGRRGLDLAHTTIMRWVQRFVPEFEKRWNRDLLARPVGLNPKPDRNFVTPIQF
jgi:hypothetical protein